MSPLAGQVATPFMVHTVCLFKLLFSWSVSLSQYPVNNVSNTAWRKDVDGFAPHLSMAANLQPKLTPPSSLGGIPRVKVKLSNT